MRTHIRLFVGASAALALACSSRAAEAAPEVPAAEVELAPAAPVFPEELRPAAQRFSWSLSVVPERPKRTNTLISEATYKRLEMIDKLVAEQEWAEVLNQYDRALRFANNLPFDSAVIRQNLAQIHLDREDYEKAIEEIEAALALDVLPYEQQDRLTLSLAQLYAVRGRFDKTIETLERWLPKAPSPGADVFLLVAQSYASLERYAEAEPYVMHALHLSAEPKEAWFQLWLGLLSEQKKYPEAAAVLETMIQLYPDRPKYWRNLASIYQILEEDLKATAVLGLAHRKGYLETETEVANLVTLLRVVEAPLHAAETLARALESGRAEETSKNYELLGQAWYDAAELERSLEAYERAASLSDEGRLDLLRGQLLLDLERYAEATEALQSAVRKGDLANPGAALLLLGYCHYELKDLERAREVFVQALEHERSQAQAEKWIGVLDEELAGVAQEG
jgi:tetratricopeptide (TPR) repeat protein